MILPSDNLTVTWTPRTEQILSEAKSRHFDVNIATYFKHIRSTLVILFYFMILPVIILILHILWTICQKWCEMCEEDPSHHPLTLAHPYILQHECCKSHVAPILSPVPPDYDFKHHCGSHCLGPSVNQNPIFS